MDRILVVDDCDFVAESIAANFGSTTVVVECAATVDAARQAIKSHNVALVIVDAILRNDNGETENGLDFVHELQQHNMPALLVSGRSDPQYSSARAFLAKPFDGETLAQSCLELLESTGTAKRCPELLRRLQQLCGDESE